MCKIIVFSFVALKLNHGKFAGWFALSHLSLKSILFNLLCA